MYYVCKTGRNRPVLVLSLYKTYCYGVCIFATIIFDGLNYVRNHLRTVKELNVIVCSFTYTTEYVPHLDGSGYDKCSPKTYTAFMYAIAGKRLLLSCADVPQCECRESNPINPTDLQFE